MKNIGRPVYSLWGCGFLVAVLALVGSPPAGAQDAADQDANQAEEPAEEAVLGLDALRVVGSRLPGRSAEDSPVPVDVIDGDSFRSFGSRDMNELISSSVPSYNTGTHAGGDNDALIRPAKMRGLPPDSTLVLVNGKRRHRGSAITTWSWGRAKGSHGVDVASIPSIALKRVEVLRDGAGAQYGSDAVAGVLNFVLRDDPAGLTVESRLGQRYHGDGDLGNIAANIGLPLTDAGFANFSFEFTNKDSTNRSVQRNDAQFLIDNGNEHVRRSPVQAWGEADVQYDYKFFGNLGLDLGDDHHAYAFGNYAERKIGDTWFFRNPSSRPPVFTDAWSGGNLLMADLAATEEQVRAWRANPDANPLPSNCPTIPQDDYAKNPNVIDAIPDDCFTLAQAFPGGFTPRWDGYVDDWSIAFGLRGSLTNEVFSLLDGWSYDMSASFGQNSITGVVRNSVNPNLIRLRHAIPTKYRATGYREFDKTFNIDLSRPFETGLFSSPLNIAIGMEYREEEFEIKTGEPSSYARDGAIALQGFGIGVSGQQGTPPEDAGTASRDNFGAYIDLETHVIEQVLFTAAGRYENFTGVGDSLDGKLASRWAVLGDYLALRGSIGTGFRAPTVGQATYRRSTTDFDSTTGRLADATTLPADHPVAQYFGAKPLKPETSVSFSLGTVINLGDLAVTLDYYNIELRNRIARSDGHRLGDPQRAELLGMGIDPGAIASVNYFTNDFDTTTQGVDLVATYPLTTAVGRTMFTLAGNWTNTKVDDYNPDISGDLYAQQIVETSPEFRFTLTADHTWGPWRLLARGRYYDDFNYFQALTLNDRMYAHARFLMDLEGSYTFFSSGVTLAVGADNLFDKYPTRNQYARSYYGEKYPGISPYGFSGGFYYVRASVEWG